MHRKLGPLRLSPQSALSGAVYLAAGLIVGAFATRALSEARTLAQARTAEWSSGVLAGLLQRESYSGGHNAGRGFVLALTLLSGIAFVVVYALRTRRRQRQVTAETSAGAPPALEIALIPLFLLGLYLVQPAPNLLQAGILFGGAWILSLLLSRPPGLEAEWPVWLLLFLLPLIAYLNTLMPAVGTRDGYELQAISATLGFAHPTGYPLFPILGRLWIAMMPFGSIAWRINLLCALFAAASVPLVYGTARRVLGPSTWGAAGEPIESPDRPPQRPSQPFLVDSRAAAAWSALLFAFSHTLWVQASQPEKYTLNALFVALTLYVAFGTGAERGPHSHLRWLGFVYGLSLTHHRTMLMLAPALALYLLWRDPGLLKRPKEWLPALGIALAPLLIYLYIPWRASAQGWVMTLDEFLRYISGAYYGPAVRLMDWATPERSLMFWRFVVAQFGYPGLALGILGLIALAARRQWQFLACTALAYATYYFWGTVWYAYYNDVNSFIPNHMLQALWIGSGVKAVGSAIAYLVDRASALVAGHRQTRSPGHTVIAPLWRAVFWSLAALMPMSMLWTNGPLVDRSDDWEMTRWGEMAITADLVSPLGLAPNAVLLADRAKHPPLDYFARIEKRRPDIEVVILGDEQAYLDRLTQELAQNGAGQTSPVYLARFLPGLEGRYHLSSTGPLVRVSTAPLTEVGELQGTPAALNAPNGTQIELLGYSAPESPLYPGQALPITLFWRAKATVPGNYHVVLRLAGARGQEWWSSADHPVSGMYPTAAWKPGEIVADWHEVPIDKVLPPGTYALQVGLFPPFLGQGLPVDGRQELWAPLITVTVTPAPAHPTPSRRLHAIAPGRLWLLGYDLPEQAPPAGRVPLRLYWQALAPLSEAPESRLESRLESPLQIGTRAISTERGQADLETGWTWAVPGRGEYPVSAWTPGTTVITEHLLTMPTQQGAATVQVSVRGNEPIDLYVGWLASKAAVLSLPPIQVAGQPPAAPGATNFDDQILLLDHDLGQRTLPPGAPLELAIHWQGMRPMENNYTLFIHLLAPNGTLKGQLDVWPKDGTHPTSQWRSGEAFGDRYLLYIAPDAPPGAYRVEIGWYLLETMQRLPVLDAQGQAIDDKVLLPGLTITASP